MRATQLGQADRAGRCTPPGSRPARSCCGPTTTVYWGLTQKTYRAEFDPAYDPTCPEARRAVLRGLVAPCPSDADYDAAFAQPSRAVHDALARVSLTGKIGKPLLTLHGTLDSLLPIRTDSDVYDAMIAGQHRDRLHRYYRIEGGNHVDSLVDATTRTSCARCCPAPAPPSTR